MNKVFFAIVIFALFFTSCKKESGIQNQIVPLKKGNYWNYYNNVLMKTSPSDTSKYFKSEVHDKVKFSTSDDSYYYVSNFPVENNEYLRYMSTMLVQVNSPYDNIIFKDIPSVNFENNDSLLLQDRIIGNYHIKTFIYKNLTNIDGHDCYKISVFDFFGYHSRRDYYFSYNIGLVKKEVWYGNYDFKLELHDITILKSYSL